ncbi:MAG: hypothetical protein ACJA10_000645 [Oleispira sp.]|jgi:hypothetical protein
MRFSSIPTLFIGLFISQFGFSAVCPSSSSSVTAGNGSCTITGSESTIQLNFNSGFNDTTTITAVGGNAGGSVGAQRKLSFIKAVEILADQIASTQTIIVDAAFSSLYCTSSVATLGSAGASTNIANVNPMPAAAIWNTFYPIGLINNLGDTDYYGSLSDINSEFNSNIGNAGCLQGSNGWYYGFDAPPSNYIGFTTVLLHEMTHGLGFASLVDASSGQKPSNLDDIFSNNLYSKLDGSSWANSGGLSNGERFASAKSNNGLLWNGSHVNTQAEGLLAAGYHDADASSSFTSGDRVQMYAPSSIETGSSVSHFDTAASPNEIMEPQYTAGQLDLGLALYLLKDIGWEIAGSASNTAPTILALDQSTNEDSIKFVDASSWGNDVDADTLTYSVNSACATNITCSINSNGTGLSMTPAANHYGGTHTITVNVSDGINTLVSDTFNLNVIAQNDAPVITGIPNQSITVGSFKDITLSGYASDIDMDSLTFSATACGVNLTCTFPNTTTIRVASNGGESSTVSVTVEVDDSNGGTNTDSFDVSIIATIPSTTVEVTGLILNNGDTFTLSDSSTQINVNNGSTNYSYELSYNSSDVGSLISSNTTGLTIALPTSGEFAGDYTLTITDDTDGDVITITVTRPLRLNWSTKAFLNGDTTQTLKIEGGAAGTVYNLFQSGSAALVFRDDIENSIIAATAEDDAERYNSALISLDSLTVASISNMDVTVQSTYDDVVEVGVQVYPSSLHQFTITNISDVVLENAVATLNGGEVLLTELNVLMSYEVDVSGEFTVLLPDTSVLTAGSTYGIQISAPGYASNTLSLRSNKTVHDVILIEMVNGIVLNGKITAQGSQNLLQKAPVVTIIYSDDISEIIPVSVTSSTRASFNYEADLNLKSLSSLIISQADSEVIELDLSNVDESQNLDVILLNSVSIVVSQPVDASEGGAAGGSLIWLNLYLLCLFFFKNKLLKRNNIRRSI